jgi:CRISPR-associated protein Csm4
LESSLVTGRLIDAFRLADPASPALPEEVLQPHNTINRYTGTTGTGMFAPYQTVRLSFADPKTRRHELYLVFDPQRLGQDKLLEMMRDVGKTGYGRDASLGLGKFEIDGVNDWSVVPVKAGQPYLTLAPCMPPPDSLTGKSSFWRPFTRFGRHGGPAFTGSVFKTPLLLADSGAVLNFVLADGKTGFVGQGLGGAGRLSKQIPGTVHQGYAPIVPLNLEGWHA